MPPMPRKNDCSTIVSSSARGFSRDSGCVAVVGCFYSTNSLAVNGVAAPRELPQIAYGSTSDALTGASLFARTTRPGADVVAAMIGAMVANRICEPSIYEALARQFLIAKKLEDLAPAEDDD